MHMSDTLRSVTRRSALALFAAFLALQRSPAEAEFPAILVHKDPNCSCCAGWVRHLKDAGFAVRVEETTNLQPVRKRLGVPADRCWISRPRDARRIAGNGRGDTSAL